MGTRDVGHGRRHRAAVGLGAREQGGSGGTVADAIEILRLAGRHAVPLPLAETGLLGGWLLAGAGIDLPDGPVTVVPGNTADTMSLDAGRIHGRVARVPWARSVDGIVALIDDSGGATVALVDPADVKIEPAMNLAGEPRDTLLFDGVVQHAMAPAASGVGAQVLHDRGAFARTASITGALEGLVEITLEYTTTHHQFGRLVAQFQAVQAHLVHAAQECELVKVALAAAVHTSTHGSASFEVASAKLLADRAANDRDPPCPPGARRDGHDTQYPLHHLSRRLWAWRAEYGTERSLSARIGSMTLRGGCRRALPPDHGR